jgi:ELWxxDGT repeat protein
MQCRLISITVGALLTGGTLLSAAETITRVTDINPGARGSYPSFLTIYRNQLLFRANTGLLDTELWSFDGTNATRVADIVPGPDGSSPANLAVLNDVLYFNATTTAGYRVWRYDGTNATRITNANPPSAFFEAAFWKPVVWQSLLWYPSQGRVYSFNGTTFSYLNTPPWAQMDLILSDGALYYGAQDMANGVELWRFNGLSQTRVTDIGPGTLDANPESLCAFRGAIYFRARGDTNGMELRCCDGNTASLVADINPGEANSNPSGLTVFRDALYFSADDGVHGYELWRYDGTNVVLAADINPNPIYQQGGDPLSDSNPRKLTVAGDALYFVADDGTYGGLWRYDGTNAVILGGGLLNAVTEIIVFQGAVYFDADDGIWGRELWKVETNPEPSLTLEVPAESTRVLLTEAETGIYMIEASTDLDRWIPVATNRPMDGQVLIQDAPASSPQRFYRAVKSP